MKTTNDKKDTPRIVEMTFPHAPKLNGCYVDLGKDINGNSKEIGPMNYGEAHKYIAEMALDTSAPLL